MKYSILGFNQEKIVTYSKDGLKCDLIDLLLLNYIIYAQSNPKMKHRVDNEMQSCVWLQHNHILEDLPILNITDGTLKNRLTKLRKMELITSKTIANENSQGTRTYYRTTSLLYDMLFEITSFKNDMVEEPRHSKMTSNTKVNNDTKVNTNNSKELLVQNFEFGKPKPQKQNRYTKCVSLIDDFTKSPMIREDLIKYLDLLIEMSNDKDNAFKLYQNVFKGMLNKLKKLVPDNDVDTLHEIIVQSIEKGYKSFFPKSQYSTRKQADNLHDRIGESGARNVPHITPEEEAELQRRVESGELPVF